MEPREEPTDAESGGLARVSVQHPHELRDLANPAHLRYLDLAFSDADAPPPRTARPPEDDNPPPPRCEAFEPTVIAARLPNLTELRTSGCGEEARHLLAELGHQLSALELADIVLDAAMVSQLSRLTGLRTLILTRVKVTAPTVRPIARALALERIVLRDLERDSVLTELLAFTRGLKEIELEGRWAGYRSMEHISKATSVQSLVLLDTSVNNWGLNQVKPLDQLRRFHWDGPRFNDHSPLYLRNLPIEELRCACPRLGNAGLRHLRLLKQLRRLELKQPNISETGYAHLSRFVGLESLHIDHCDVSDAIFAALAPLTKLHTLELTNASLTSRDTPSLALLTGLRHLVLRLDGFDDTPATHLAALTELRSLNLGGTDISDAGLSAITRLENLRALSLHHTRVTNRGLQHVGTLTRLEKLELDHTDLVDDGLRHLAALRELRELRLDNTLVTDVGMANLAGMTALERLNVANTVISDRGAAELAKLPALQTVDLRGTRVRTYNQDRHATEPSTLPDGQAAPR